MRHNFKVEAVSATIVLTLGLPRHPGQRSLRVLRAGDLGRPHTPWIVP